MRWGAALLSLVVAMSGLASCSDPETPQAAASKSPAAAQVAPASTPSTAQAAPPTSPSAMPVATPAPAVQTFVNSPDNLDGSLAENYVDFSFSYPSNWTLDPESGKPGASNFAKVTHDIDGGFTLENFAVGYFAGTGSAAGDAAVFPKMVDALSKQFEPGFPGYRKISEGKTRVGDYDGYELRFESTIPETGKGTMRIWARAVMIPVAGSTHGVLIIMMATNLSPDVQGIEDVGVKGDLPLVLNSLKLGE